MLENNKKFTESVLNVINRNVLAITGVEKMFSVSDSQIHLLACGDSLLITGQDLTVVKLDVENGNLKVTGKIGTMKYNDKKENLLKRVFK